MLKTGVQHLPDMVIGEGVIDRFPVPPEFHELCLAKGGKLMRNGGFGHVEDVGDVADTKLVLLMRVGSPSTLKKVVTCAKSASDSIFAVTQRTAASCTTLQSQENGFFNMYRTPFG